MERLSELEPKRKRHKSGSGSGLSSDERIRSRWPNPLPPARRQKIMEHLKTKGRKILYTTIENCGAKVYELIEPGCYTISDRS